MWNRSRWKWGKERWQSVGFIRETQDRAPVRLMTHHRSTISLQIAYFLGSFDRYKYSLSERMCRMGAPAGLDLS